MNKLKDDNYSFNWSDLGDIGVGRPNLGGNTSVAVYRLMQYTMRSVLVKDFGAEKAATLFFDAGMVAGKAFCENLLDKSLSFNDFVAQLQATLIEMKIGALRVEKTDLENLNFVFVVTEDLDCSGLPITDETVCDYDEGFIAGILQSYTGTAFHVKEVDCWSKGDRVCRFEAKVKNEE